MGVGCGLEIPPHPTRGVLWIQLKPEHKPGKEQSCAELLAMGPGLEIRPGALLEGAREGFDAFRTFPGGPGWLCPCILPPCPCVRVGRGSAAVPSARVQHVSGMEPLCCGAGMGILIQEGARRGWGPGTSCRNGVQGKRSPPLPIALRPSRVSRCNRSFCLAQIDLGGGDGGSEKRDKCILL